MVRKGVRTFLTLAHVSPYRIDAASKAGCQRTRLMMSRELTPFDVLSRQLPESHCGREIARIDWSLTAFGPTRDWPQSLVSLLATGLACPAPMLLAWGPDLTAFCNDAAVAAASARDHMAGAIGRSARDLLGAVWEQVSPAIDGALAGRSSVMTDMHFQRPAGGERIECWWSWTASPVRDEAGTIAGFLCMGVETTRRVVAQRGRDAAAERLRAAFSAGDSIGAWDWDVVRNLVTADWRFSLIYNVEPERAAKGVALEEFIAAIHPDDRPRVKAQIQAAIDSQEGYCSEYRIVSSTGEEQWISAQGRPVYDDEGNCIRFPGLSFDITANKRAEQARRARTDRSPRTKASP